MATRDEMFPSRFLKAPDLNGKPLVVTIASADRETMKDTSGKEKEKLILSLKEVKKQLVLNATNWDAIVDILDEANSDDWTDGRIELYPAKTNLPGRGVVDCIRVRAPSQAHLPMKAKGKLRSIADETLDDVDDIPFAPQ